MNIPNLTLFTFYKHFFKYAITRLHLFENIHILSIPRIISKNILKNSLRKTNFHRKDVTRVQIILFSQSLEKII